MKDGLTDDDRLSVQGLDEIKGEPGYFTQFCEDMRDQFVEMTKKEMSLMCKIEEKEDKEK